MTQSERDEAHGTFVGISRRGLGRGVVAAASASGLLLSGCRRCFSPEPPRVETRRTRGPRTFTVRARVQPGRYRALVEMLDDPDFNPFEVPSPGIHFCRLFTTDHQYLYFMVVYDAYPAALELLRANAAGIDRVFDHCVDYPGATDVAKLDAYVRRTQLCVELFYRAYNESQEEIREALLLRDHFLALLRSIEGVSEAKLRELYGGFVTQASMATFDRRPGHDDGSEAEVGEPVPLMPLVQQGPVQGPVQALPPVPVARALVTNAPDRVSPFTMMARVDPSKLVMLSRRLRLGTYAVIDLGLRPLENLPTLHFARVSIIDGDRMLFASVYDGEFLQYVEDFGTRIADEIDKVFGSCVGYPIAGSRDVFAFRDFLRANQIVTRDFAGTYLDRSLLQIQASLALARAVARFRRRVGPEHRNLPARLQRFLYDNQGLLA
jgi:hypothetical protein